MTTTKFTAWALGVGATAFVLLLAGIASGALTDDPPAVSPYATGSPGNSSTTTVAASEVATETTTAAAGPTIVIADFAFGEPAIATVGQEVTVLNNDGATHTWTSRDGLFDSESLRSGDSFTHVFDTAGTFEFFCAIHPSMTGSISVSG
jgi:plastocyanin